MQNNHLLNIKDKHLELWRYPKQAEDSPLQAWDNSDVLLIEAALENCTEQQNPVILNDHFGAISLMLSELKPQTYSDSIISQLAINTNAQLNGLDALTCLTDLKSLPSAAVYILKIPKNLDFLEAQLKQIQTSLPNDAKVFASAKSSDINNRVKKLFQRYFKQVDVGLTHKKCRLICASQATEAPYSSHQYFALTQSPSGADVQSAPNVFSRKQIDMGADFLIKNLPDCQDKHVIDLACGNGILALEVLQNNQPKQITLVDESYMAIESAQRNLEIFSKDLPIEYRVNDCLSEFAHNQADIILCNPPFHQNKTLTTHIAEQMFADAANVLHEGGQLLVVANRHLPYARVLQEYFKSVKCLNQNNKFTIYQAIKGSI